MLLSSGAGFVHKFPRILPKKRLDELYEKIGYFIPDIAFYKDEIG